MIYECGLAKAATPLCEGVFRYSVFQADASHHLLVLVRSKPWEEDKPAT